RRRPPPGGDLNHCKLYDRVARAYRPAELLPADRPGQSAPGLPADDDHAVARRSQRPAERPADETGGTGYEHTHVAPQSVCVDWKSRFPIPEKRARLLRSMAPRKAGKSWKKRLRRAARGSK